MRRFGRTALAVLLGTALGTVPSAHAQSVDRHVPRDYAMIGEALAAASSGDRIIVTGGSYQECVTVTGRSDLVIVGRRDPVIDVTGCASGITIADGARIALEGFIVAGNAVHGILVEPTASDVLIAETVIADVP